MPITPTPLLKHRMRPGFLGVCGVLCLVAFAAHAGEPPVTEEVEFNSAAGNRPFTPRYKIQNRSEIEGRGGASIRTLLEAEGAADAGGAKIGGAHGGDGLGTLDHLLSSYQSQGLKITRLSTAWETGGGTFTVGNDWANFQDFLADANGDTGYSSLFAEKQTAEQVAWSGRSGFSIALEKNRDGGAAAASDNIDSLQTLSKDSSNLVVSWQGGFADEAGRYKVSALGRKLDLKGTHNGVEVDDSEAGWGVKLAGGWRFGDLLVALSVTLGDGIDSLIMKRFGSDVAVSPSGRAETLASLSVLPSLTYDINERSDFRVSLGRYKAEDGGAAGGVDTLDTISLGYTWSPWPDIKFGVEVVGQDVDGAISAEDTTEVKFGAQQRF